MILLTISEDVLFELDRLRNCIKMNCPEFELNEDPDEISLVAANKLGTKRMDILKESETQNIEKEQY